MRVVFIASLGRSGTASISRYFNIEHEAPDRWDISVEGIKERVKDHQGEFFGKVGHNVMKVVPRLVEKFPSAFFVHNVRHPRKVVAAFNRVILQEPEVYMGLEKTIPDFMKLSKFERICRMCVYWNEVAEKNIPFRVKFEDFCQYLPQTNSTMKLDRPSTQWGRGEEGIFERVCGNMCKRYGYEI